MNIETIAQLFEASPIMSVVVFLFLFNSGLTLIEAVVDISTNAKRDWRDSAANFSIFVVMQLLEKTAYSGIFLLGLLPFYYWLSPFEIPMTGLTWLLAFIVADFSYYWMHRVEHKYRIFWAHHSVHHSSEDYNLTIAFRLCVIESMVEWIFLIPMVLVGFNPFQTIVAFILIVQYQSWIHTKHIDKLAWLDGIINTPSSHRVHHASNRQYWDKNFGSVLMLWDRLFGTYEREQETVVFGLDKNIGTHNPIKINLFEYQRLLRDIRMQKTLKNKLCVLVAKLSV